MVGDVEFTHEPGKTISPCVMKLTYQNHGTNSMSTHLLSGTASDRLASVFVQTPLALTRFYGCVRTAISFTHRIQIWKYYEIVYVVSHKIRLCLTISLQTSE